MSSESFFSRGGRVLPRGDLPPFVTQFEGDLTRVDRPNTIPIQVHAENLAVFLPKISRRRWQVEWGTVLYRTIAALMVLEHICCGNPDFGYKSHGFAEKFKAYLGNRRWVTAVVFGTVGVGEKEENRADVWPLVSVQGERRERRVRRPRSLPAVVKFADGYFGSGHDDRRVFNQYLKKALGSDAKVLGMGPLNKFWMGGAPGQHWLGVYPDIWERAPAPIPEGNEALRPVNVGGNPNLLRKSRRHGNRKWWGFWLPRTDWMLPEWAGFDEVRQMASRTFPKGRKREKIFKEGQVALDKASRRAILNHLGFGREIDWHRWIYNGWHLFDGALEAVQGCADEKVRERLGTHPFSDCLGGPGSPLRDPRGKPGERGSYIDWVETEAPWVHVRFSREYKRELLNEFNKVKEEWYEMEDPIKGLAKPIRKIVEPFEQEARQMTEREKHTHIMALGDGTGAFCKHVGELRMQLDDAYKLAFPDRSDNINTVRGSASRLIRDDRVALGIAIFALSRQTIVKQAADVKFEELHTRIMEVYQAALDVANHKEALNAIKLLADISGHTAKSKAAAPTSGVNVNILNQSSGGNPNHVNLPAGGDTSSSLMLIENSPSMSGVLIPESREQKAKNRLKQLINVMDTKEKEMEWVNTTNLAIEEDEDDDV